MDFTLIEGIISGLDRTTQISGGGETSATTTHISIFNLLDERVLLKTESPAMIANGDHLKLVGVRGQGQFTAIACTLAAVSAFGLIGIIFTYISPIFIFLPMIIAGILFWLLKTGAKMKAAHQMLNQ
jgi:hypothetical protein